MVDPIIEEYRNKVQDIDAQILTSNDEPIKDIDLTDNLENIQSK